MTKNTKARATDTSNTVTVPTKHKQIIDLLSRTGGASLEDMSNLAKWLPHSTRAFMTGLKKKGYIIQSDKADCVRRYRITSSPAA